MELNGTVTFHLTKARGGYVMNAVQEYDHEKGLPGKQETVVLPGDNLEPEELGRQIVATLVSMRVTK